MKTQTILSAIILLMIIFLVSCRKKNEFKVSKHNSSESHNMGENCMNCHKQGGHGEGWFNIAATVYDKSLQNTYPNTTVRLYTGPNGTGTLRYTVEVDGKGNFYSTENINFDTGLYPAVQGKSITKYMSTPITIGSCASCHVSTTSRIWTE